MSKSNVESAIHELNLELGYRRALIKRDERRFPLPERRFEGSPIARIINLDPLDYELYVGRKHPAPYLVGTMIVQSLVAIPGEVGSKLWIGGQIGSEIYAVEGSDPDLINGIAVDLGRHDLATFDRP